MSSSIKNKFDAFLDLLSTGVTEADAQASVELTDDDLYDLLDDDINVSKISKSKADFSINLMISINKRIQDDPRLALEMLKLTKPTLQQVDVQLDLVSELSKRDQ